MYDMYDMYKNINEKIEEINKLAQLLDSSTSGLDEVSFSKIRFLQGIIYDIQDNLDFVSSEYYRYINSDNI